MPNSSIIAGPFLRADYADTRSPIKMLFTPLPGASKARLMRLFLATRRKNNDNT